MILLFIRKVAKIKESLNSLDVPTDLKRGILFLI